MIAKARESFMNAVSQRVDFANAEAQRYANIFNILDDINRLSFKANGNQRISTKKKPRDMRKKYLEGVIESQTRIAEKLNILENKYDFSDLATRREQLESKNFETIRDWANTSKEIYSTKAVAGLWIGAFVFGK